MSRKDATLFLAMPNLKRFQNFLHCWKENELQLNMLLHYFVNFKHSKIILAIKTYHVKVSHTFKRSNQLLTLSQNLLKISSFNQHTRSHADACVTRYCWESTVSFLGRQRSHTEPDRLSTPQLISPE